MNYKKTLVIVFLVTISCSSFSFSNIAQETDIFAAEPVLFVPITESSGSQDFTFPNLNPIGVKEDSKGNIHSWMYYIQEDLVHVYYITVLTNGTTQFFEGLRP